MTATAPVATRWCGQPPSAAADVRKPATYRRPPASAPRFHEPPHDLGTALVRLLQTDVRRRHWRIAIRHFLMLTACGYEVPEALEEQCMRWAGTCAPGEFEKISARVAAWHGWREAPEHSTTATLASEVASVSGGERGLSEFSCEDH